ncbi:MAG: hypothetical protein ACYTGN_09700, partial [Planctomycetota bacterium]
MHRFLIALGLLATVASAQPAQDLASLLPPDTLVMLEADDMGGMQRWMKEAALGRVWAEPEVQYFAKNLNKELDKGMAMAGQFLGMVGLTAEDLEGIEIRRLGVAVVSFEMVGRMPSFDAVLTLQTRSGHEKIGKIVDALRNALGMFVGVVAEKSEIRGREVWTVTVPGTEVLWCVKGDRMVMATSKARMEAVLKAVDEAQETSLRTAPRFANIVARMKAENAALTVYADVKGLHAKLLPMAKAEVDTSEFDHAWKALGLDGVEAFAFCDIPQGTNMRTEFAITHAPGEPRGIFKLIRGGGVNHRFAKHAPKGCMLYGGENWNASEAYKTVIELYGAFEPRAQERVAQAEGWVKQALGVDLKADLLASIGDDWAAYVGAPPGGGFIPDVCVFVSCKDKAKLETTMNTLMTHVIGLAAEEGEKIHRRSTLFRGLTIHSLEHKEMPLAPCWAFGDDYLVMALVPHAIRNAHVEKASLAGDEDFRSLSRQIPAGSSSATYVNTGKLVRWAYNTLVPILQAAQGPINDQLRGFDLRLNFQDLPTVEVLTRHLGGMMCYTSPEDGCLRMGFVSSFGSTVAIAGVAMM